MTQPTATPSTPSGPDGGAAAPGTRGPRESVADLDAGSLLPGSVSITNRMRKSAGAMFDGSVTVSDSGSLFGGDQNNIYVQAGMSAELTLHQVSRAEQDELGRVFVEPQGFTQIREVARSRRILFIRAPQGHGRGATAQRVLSGCADELFRLPAGADLGILRADRLRQRGGYLWTDLSEKDCRDLQGAVLRGVEALLDGVDARLVITVSTQVHIADPDVLDRVIDLGAPATEMDVLRRHLDMHLGTGIAEALLSHPVNRDALAELVSGGRGLRYVARVARICVEELVSGVLQIDRVRSRATQEDQADFANWFDMLPDIATKSHAISLAVFQGLPYRAVAVQGEVLQRFIERPNLPVGVQLEAQFTEVTRNPFAQSRSRRLADLRARVSPGNVTTLYGDVPSEIVSYHDERYSQALLERVCSEFPDVHRAVLDWLRSAGDNADDSVRVWAAEAVGFLATLDFNTVLHTVITPWAANDDERLRDAAAFTLAAPAAKGLQGQVHSLVRNWSADDDDELGPNLRMTAIRAYGASIGRKRPDQALEEIEQSVREDDLDIAFTAARSLADLIDFDVTLTTDVLALLNRWTRSTDQYRHDAAELAFLLIAAATQAPADDEDGSVRWPLLLKLSEDDRELCRTIADFWRRVLNGRSLQEVARGVLTEWARTVDSDRRSREALARLALQIGTAQHSAALESRTRKILKRLADRWDGRIPPHPANASRAAAAVRSLLI